MEIESLDLRLVQLRTLGTDAWRMEQFQVPSMECDGDDLGGMSLCKPQLARSPKKWWVGKESPQNALNLGLGIIVILSSG